MPFYLKLYGQVHHLYIPISINLPLTFINNFWLRQQPRSPNVSVCVCLCVSHLLQLYWTSWSTKFTSLQVAAPGSSRLVIILTKWSGWRISMKMLFKSGFTDSHLLQALEQFTLKWLWLVAITKAKRFILSFYLKTW